MAYLFLFSSGQGEKFPLADRTTIGRHENNLLRLADSSVSKFHCLITRDGNNRFHLVDQGSTNGTYLNGHRIAAITELRPGDEIRLGDLALFFEEEQGMASRMVEISDNNEAYFNSTLSLKEGFLFLPEEKIVDERILRADYEKLRVTYELQNEMNLERELDKTLNRIWARSAEFLQYDHGVILLLDRNGQMVPHSYKSRDRNEKFTVSSTLVKYVQEERTGVISTDIQDDARFNAAESILIEGIKSTIAAPMMVQNEILGVMILSSRRATYAFTAKDLGLITAIAGQAARIIKNFNLHHELRLSYDSSIRTLSATVDARHPLTAGHSERVTELSVMIARKLNLAEQEISVLRFAALMHDIGKIAVPDCILLKNGRFSAEEKAIMDIHPIKSREILNNFSFPEFMKDVPLIAGCHHERLDGTGYPYGLRGQSVPFLSRILAVADTYDALTSRRDYPKYVGNENKGHEALPLATVFSIIHQGAGSHFDPAVVAALMDCFPPSMRPAIPLAATSN